MDEIEEKIRKIPLAERLEKSLKIVKSIASDGRDLRMSILFNRLTKTCFW